MAAFCARVVREPSQVRRRTHTHTHTHPVQVCPLNLFALHGAPAGPHVCTAGLLSASRHASGVPAAEEAAPGARPRARPANSACAPAAGGLTPTLADQPAPHVAALPFALACTLAQRRPAGPDRGRRSLHAHSGGLLAAPPDSRCSAARLCVSKARRAEFRDAGRPQRVVCLSARAPHLHLLLGRAQLLQHGRRAGHAPLHLGRARGKRAQALAGGRWG